MPAVARPLHLRLFLEGEEVPVIAAQVNTNTNSAAVASIQIIPLDQAMDFKPRTMVHLFFLDQQADSAVQQVRTSAGLFPIRGKYRTLFTGEAIGFSLVQTPASRSIVLQCADFSYYWDSAHVTAMEYGPGGNAVTDMGDASFAGGDASGMFNDLVNHQANQIKSWVNQTPSTPGLTGVSGLAGGVIRIMEAMGGVTGEHRGINDFFTVAELRCRLLQQITAEENDSTAQNLLSGKVFDQWIRVGLQNIGQQVTFRDMMLMLFGYILYEFVPNPAPKFDHDFSSSSAGGNQRKKLAEISTVLSAVRRLENAMGLLDAASGGTEAGFISKVVAHILKSLDEAAKDLKDARQSHPKISADIQTILNVITAAIAKVEEVFRSQAFTGFAGVSQSLASAVNSIRTSTSEVVTYTQRSSSSVQRLRAQIVRPDCWFVAPPRCNVIFPEMYSQLSYDRNWMGETTRLNLQLYLSIVGDDKLTNRRIIAPPFHMTGASVLKYVKGPDSYRVLLDHELHTGIVPKTERIANTSATSKEAIGTEKGKLQGRLLDWCQRSAMFHFFKSRFASRQASVGGRFNPRVVCGFPAVIIRQPLILPESLAQPLAGKTDQEVVNNIEKIAGSGGVAVPHQLVGMVAGVSHNIDQSGGTTSVTLSHVRKHTGIDDEFLALRYGYNEAKVTRTLKVTLSANAAKADASGKIKKLLIDVTPPASVETTRTVQSVSVTEVTKESTTSKVNPETGEVVSVTQTHAVPATQEKTITEVTNPPRTKRSTLTLSGVVLKDVLVPSPSGKVFAGNGKGLFGGPVVAVEVLDDGSVEALGDHTVFRRVNVYETVEITRAAGDMPFEDFVRPDWLSPAYKNANITKQIYTPFFGCAAVVDDLVVAGLSAVDITAAGLNPGAMAISEAAIADLTIDKVLKMVREEEDQRRLVSTSRAVTLLSYLYGRVKQQGLDVEEFIRMYTDRPIATKEDLLGDDPEFTLANKRIKSVKGKVGFHTGAVDRKLVESGVPFLGLIEDPDSKLSRINNQGRVEAMPPPYDVRRAKKEKVLDYIRALTEKGPAYRG